MRTPTTEMSDGVYPLTLWLRAGWPWLALAVGVLVIVVGGILFSHL